MFGSVPLHSYAMRYVLIRLTDELGFSQCALEKVILYLKMGPRDSSQYSVSDAHWTAVESSSIEVREQTFRFKMSI
jgi:hypothetical protein